MATAPRFNLSLLRRMAQSARSAATSASNETRPQSNTNTGNISRRKFLALTGSGSALAVVPGYLRGDGFEIVREGRAIHLLTGGHKRWTVDPCCFGARAMVSVERGSDEIRIGLRRAVFAGTEMTADLQAVLQRCGKTWFLRLRMAYGLNYEAELLPWLEGSAAGTGELAAGVLRPFQGMAIIHPFSKVSFAPSWEMNATSGGEVRLQWLDKRLPMSEWWMSPAPVEQLAGGLEGQRTMFRFARAGTDWDIPLRRVASEGWSIEHG